MSVLQFVIEWIAAEWGWLTGLLAGVFGFFGTMFAASPAFRERLAKPVLADLTGAEAGAGTPYARLVGHALDRIARWTTPASVEEHGWVFRDLRAATRVEAARVGGHPFGWGLFDRALALAFLYPILLLFLVWIATGWEMWIGDLPVLPPRPDWWWERTAAIGLMAVCGVYFTLRQSARFIVKLIALIGALIYAVVYAVAIAVAGAVAVAVAAAVVYAVASAVAFAVGVAGAFAVTVAGAGAVAFVVAGAGAGAGAVAVAVACAAASALVLGLSRLAAARRGGLSFLLLTLFTFAGFLAAAAFGDF
ncbi:MAG: hypothetical protein AAFR17_10060 [Pseudomonadota bacterium]